MGSPELRSETEQENDSGSFISCSLRISPGTILH